MYLKRSVLLMCVFFTVAMVGYTQYTVELPYKNVTVENINGNAVFHGVASSGKPGQPGLPVYSVTFLLPPGTNPEDVIVSVQNPIDMELPEALYVEPARPLVSLDQEPVAQGEYPKDMSVYGKKAFFPGSWTGAVSFGKYRQYQLVKVSINACMYNPVLQKVKMLTGGTLVLTLKGQSGAKQKSLSPDAPQSLSQPATAAAPILTDLIVNPEALDEYTTVSRSLTLPLSLGQLPGYAIITTNGIAGVSTQMQNLIYQKTLEGYNVILATENDWGGGYGDTAAENIRAWLKDNDFYLTENIQYVLLIGHPDPQYGDVPMKTTYPVQDWLTQVIDMDGMRPSDFYYAELSGDWDYNDDNYYGSYFSDFVPGGADQYAEVAVGRIPYYGSMTDLDHILAKSISYTNTADSAWRKRIMLPMKAGYTWQPGTWVLGERIKNVLCTDGDWNYYRLYDEIDPYSDLPIAEVSEMCPLPESRYCTIPNVLDAWTNYHPGLAVWITHGWSTGATDVIDSSSAAYLDDNHPSMTFQVSCQNSWPEEPNNLAYSILRNGGITTIGATRNALVTAYTTETQIILNEPSADGLAYGYAGRVMTEGLASADALIQTFNNTLLPEYYDSGWVNMVEFCLYGCPDIALDISADQPAAPTDLRTESTPTVITLNWIDNSNSETGYRIERAQIGGVFSEIAQISADSTSYTDTYNLSPNTVYKYLVRAVNGSVYSLYSPLSYGETGPCPSAPVWGTCAYALDNQLSLSWQPVTGAVYYTLRRSINSDGPFSTCATNLTTTSFTTIALDGSGITYYFIVTATNDHGCEGEDSNVLDMTPIWTDPLPPTGFTVTEGMDTAPYFYISWTDQSHAEIGYDIERKEFGEADWTLIAQTCCYYTEPNRSNYTNYTDYDISTHTAYSYRVRGRGRVIGFSDYTDPATAITLAPSGLTASVNGMTVDLSWEEVSSFSHDQYGIESSTDGINFGILDSVDYTQTSYTDINVYPGMTYYYRVFSGNAFSQSETSNVVSVTMPAVTIYYKAQNTAATTNQLQPWFKIKNTGTTTIDLADVSLHYWYTREGTSPQSTACDYAGLGGVNITPYVNMNLVPVTPALTGANFYLEISFDSGAGSLAPGQETDDIQIRIWKTDWTNYTQTDDYSFDASMTSFTINTNVTGYIEGTRVFGYLP